MGKHAALVVVALSVAACGRIGYDEVAGPAVIDAPPVAPTCPADTAPIHEGANVCIEKATRGTATWLLANDACTALGRRLCEDAEWLTACEMATGLMDMAGGTDSTWEWMADNDGVTAQKRGLDACTDTSSHEIDSGDYDFRCCVGL
ncbi:MAG: hypothetical protein KF773_35235 [Deltaproteobacteria bacterium]|nr:hypothetical protein [Deltaproteobacteria bacterium]MCW5805311.1 hypothetical protein [Deltaproteobacteria bacterium]